MNDVAPSNRPPAYAAVNSGGDYEDFRLLNSAREEILAIRSSLPRTAEIGGEALQAKIVRHSKRISHMLQDDKARLSQRWSVTLQDRPEAVPDTLQPASTEKNPENDATGQPRSEQIDVSTLYSARHGTREEFILDPHSTEQYQTFLTWIVQLETSFRQVVLRTLKQDIRRRHEQVISHTGQ